MTQDNESRKEEEEEEVRVRIEEDDAKEEAQKYFEDRVDQVKEKLEENSTHRTLFVTEPFEYLSREGLLQDADEVRVSMDEGGFEDLALIQSIGRRQELAGRRGRIGVDITVCVTIVWRGLVIRICVSKRF